MRRAVPMLVVFGLVLGGNVALVYFRGGAGRAAGLSAIRHRVLGGGLVHPITVCRFEGGGGCYRGGVLVLDVDWGAGVSVGLTAGHLFGSGGWSDCWVGLGLGEVGCTPVEFGGGEGVGGDWAVVRIDGVWGGAVRFCERADRSVWGRRVSIVGYPSGELRTFSGVGVSGSGEVVLVQLKEKVGDIGGISGGAIYDDERGCVVGMVVGYLELPCEHKLLVGVRPLRVVGR